MRASKPLAVTLLFLATLISLALVFYQWYQAQKETLAWNVSVLNQPVPNLNGEE